MSKRKNKPQGHPERTSRDALNIEVEKLARRVVELAPKVIRDPRLTPKTP